MADAFPWEEAGKVPTDKPVVAEASPWEEAKPQVGTAEDIYKTAGPSVLRGTLGLLTAPGTLAEGISKGADWAFHKVAPETAANLDAKRENLMKTDPRYAAYVDMTHRFDPLFPSYGTAVKKVEENVTGPMYHAQTPGGKVAQTSMEVAPQLLAGGEGLIPAAAKAIGAGVGSEGAGAAARAVKDKLPESAQPYAEPVAKAVGLMAGTFAPSVARRGVTPNPVSNEQLATVNALRSQGFPMTAGQATESPALRALEGRTHLAGVPAQQEEAFTRGAMQQMGSGGRFNAQNLQAGDAVGAELGQLRRANQVNPQEYAGLVHDTRNAQANFGRTYGATNTGDIDAATNLITRTNPNLNMPGAQYEMVRHQLQGLIDNASTPQAAHAISGLRQRLDQAFYNSVQSDVANRARELGNQYVNYSTLQRVPAKVGRETVTPQEVLTAVSGKSGRRAANEEQGSLAPYAQQAGRVMSEVPLPTEEKASAFQKLLGMGLGGGVGGGVSMFHGGPAWPESLVGGIAGREAIGPMLDLLKGGAARVAASGLGQRYLANQQWRPGANSHAPSQADLIRLLMSPPEQRAISGQ